MPKKGYRVRDWTDYPPQLAEYLLEFQASGGLQIGPVGRAAAFGARIEFYRYRTAINEAIKLGRVGQELPSEDLLQLHDIAASVVVVVDERPPRSGQWSVLFTKSVWSLGSKPLADDLTVVPQSPDGSGGNSDPAS